MDLSKLNDELWTFHPRQGLRGYDYYSERDNRFLSRAEWEGTKAAIKEQNLFCTPGSGVFGFGFCLNLWKEGLPPPYPGVEGEEEFQPKCVLSVTHIHFQKILEMSRGPNLSEEFWNKIIEPLVYSEENLALITKNGVEAPRNKSHYDY